MQGSGVASIQGSVFASIHGVGFAGIQDLESASIGFRFRVYLHRVPMEDVLR